MTPLQEAAGAGATMACGMLLAKGADPNHRDHDGKSALDWAREGKQRCEGLWPSDPDSAEAVFDVLG